MPYPAQTRQRIDLPNDASARERIKQARRKREREEELRAMEAMLELLKQEEAKNESTP